MAHLACERLQKEIQALRLPRHYPGSPPNENPDLFKDDQRRIEQLLQQEVERVKSKSRARAAMQSTEAEGSDCASL